MLEHPPTAHYMITISITIEKIIRGVDNAAIGQIKDCTHTVLNMSDTHEKMA